MVSLRSSCHSLNIGDSRAPAYCAAPSFRTLQPGFFEYRSKLTSLWQADESDLIGAPGRFSRELSEKSITVSALLQAGLAEPGGAQAAAALVAFKGSGLLGPAGVCTTTVASGQQWDAPNAWPPLQDMIVQGFAATGGAPTPALLPDSKSNSAASTTY